MNRASRPRLSRISGSSYASKLLGRAGDGSTLSLDFTTGVLDPRLTFTRSTTGTYINSSGYVTSAAINAPRFDYDPTTLSPRGLLIEGSATNLLNWSESFATSGGGVLWSYNTYITRNTTQIVSPDGTQNAYRFNETTDNQIHRISTSVTGSAGAYVLSIWVQIIDESAPRRLYINAIAFMGVGALFNIDPATQTGASGSAVALTGTAANRAGTWVKYPNNWYRCSILGTYIANQTIYFQINRASSTTATDDTFAGSTSNGLALWGAQLEAGSGASSSYIPTGASTGSRAADKMSMTDISTMQWNQTQGTFLLHMDVAAETNFSSFPAFMGMYTATPVRVFRFLLNNGSGTNPRIGNDTWTAAPTQIAANLVTRSTAPTAFKFAVSSSNTGQTVNQVVNAGSVTTTSGTGTLQTPTRLLWQQDPSALDTEYFPIHIRSLKYWPTALPNAQLQSITT